MPKPIKVISLLVCAMLLLTVRGFEDALFYDPFSAYFRSDYMSVGFPDFESGRLFWSLSLRYFVNSAISIAVIYLLFSDGKLVKFTSVLYLVFYVILIAAFFATVHLLDKESNFTLFYLRRFLIQPLFLLLFVPAFYYQKRMAKK